MKTKYALIALLAITFFGCDDNTAGLGLGMFPNSDQNLNGKLSTFDVTTESVPTGRIYAKTNIGYVGKFTDNTFGAYNAGFLAALNCPVGLTFPKVYTEYDEDGNLVSETGKKAVKGIGSMVIEPADDITLIKNDNDEVIGNIHTTEIYLWYGSYFGDSLTACRLSVYELDKKIKEDNAYYTDINPEDYKGQLLGMKAYTAVDLTVEESIRNSDDDYVPSVHVSIKDGVAAEIGGRILKAARISPLDNNKFSEAFKGIYVKSDYGDGTVLYVFKSQLNVVYKCYETDTITGLKTLKKELEKGDTEYKDSTYYSSRPFYSTREVIQANQLTNDPQKIAEIIAEGKNTYLKTPAGIFTQATLPISAIGEQLKQDTLNAVKLTFSNYNQTSDKKFGMSIPYNVLLIRKKYKDSFFEKNQLNDNITSYTANHLSNTNQYVFNNITNLINDCLADGEREAAEKDFKDGKVSDVKDENGNPVTNIEMWEKYSDWNKVVLIPVLITLDSSGNNGGQSNVIGIQHDLKPGYVKLKGGKKGEELTPAIDFPLTNPDGTIRMVPKYPEFVLKLEVISTNFGVAAK